MRDDEILDVEPQPDTDPHLTDPRSEEGNSRDLPADMSLGQIFISFFKIGAFTFGGGWAMVPLIQKELVDKRGWLDDSEFVDILAIAQSGPGPVAINTSVLCGNKMRGLLGAIVAALGSSLPSFLIILVIANFFLKVKESRAVQAIFKGMRPAIFGLLISAVWQVGRKSISDKKDLVLAASGAALLLFLDVNPIFVVILAAVAGIIFGSVQSSKSKKG
ncbi:MAG: chromate transporter [Bacillota bacterium]